MYIHRHAEDTVRELSKMFGAVLVAGPRQVGKTTMLGHLVGKSNSVSLDDGFELSMARTQSSTFFKEHIPPVFIDEIQKAPELFPRIKLQIDQSHKKGQFYLCGSQQFAMMKNVSESLTGRIGLVTLLGLSLREINLSNNKDVFLPTEEYLKKAMSHKISVSYDEVWERIYRGSLPEIVVNEKYNKEKFYAGYVTSYVERDVHEYLRIGDVVRFQRFMGAVAALSGQMLNLTALAREAGISQPTAEQWLSALIASNLVYLLRPYSNNLLKRVTRTPKLYFLDTGLASYLTHWPSADVLRNGAMGGAIFETFVVSEIVKSYYNQGVIDPPLYYYRDKEMREIDLLIEQGDSLYPLEIKKHVDPTTQDIRNFSVLDKVINRKRQPGGVICCYDRVAYLQDDDRVIPVTAL